MVQKPVIFDTHAHYTDEIFDNDRDDLLCNLGEKGVSKIINCSVDIEDSIKTLKLSKKYKNIYCALGIHPENLDSIVNDSWKKELESLICNEKVVAIGETGLDYYWEKDKAKRKLQIEVFEQQVIIAIKHCLPVIIHDREAHKDVLDIIVKYRPKGVVHCFSGSLEFAKQLVKLGLYIGIGGVVTFKNARHIIEVVREIPLDYLLLETDAPYLAPVPYRGKRNDSSLIKYIANTIADVRNTPYNKIVLATYNNAVKLFSV